MNESPRLLDVNVLIALTNPNHVHHTAAHRWFRGKPWATTPLTESAFVRLMTNLHVAGEDVTAATALDVLERLREQPGHRFIADSSSLTEPAISTAALLGRKQVTDFHLVNLAASTGAVLATFDTRISAALAPVDRGFIEPVPVD